VELNDLKSLLDVLRASGVTAYSQGELHITLGPVKAPASLERKGPAPEKSSLQPSICRCGHTYTRHRETGCVEGCPITLCVNDGDLK
jgi:hypothetical protein